MWRIEVVEKKGLKSTKNKKSVVDAIEEHNETM